LGTIGSVVGLGTGINISISIVVAVLVVIVNIVFLLVPSSPLAGSPGASPGLAR
jgi:hypothetical protein